MIAEFVEMPSVSSVSSIIIEGGNIFLNREIDGGTESITVPTPFLAVVQKGIAIEPKIPSMRGIMMARTKQLSVMEAVQSSMLTEYVGYDLPGAKSKCKMISEDSVSELVDLLKNEAKVI
jgi:electron transfer flavoprotein beta subunit